MDWLTFTSSLISSLAWPLIVVALAIVFRRELRPLIGSLRKFTWGDKILEFDRRLEAAEVEAIRLPQPPEPPPQLPTPDEQLTIEAAEIPPQLAVVEAWLPLERELYSVGAKHGYGAGRARSATYLLGRLTADGILDGKTERLIHELREMRNIALHSPEGRAISAHDAKRYRELAATAIEALKAANS